MNKTLKKLEGTSLSGRDIINLCGGKVKVVVYDELNRYNSIDELLEPYDSVILLYRSSENFGHWCGINKIKKNTVEFFDPYGLMVDAELGWNTDRVNTKLNQEHTVLSNLLLNSKYNIDYNEHKFQSMKDNVNTCGRWCVIRTILKDISLEDFAKLFKSRNVDNDLLVTYLTMNLKNDV